MSKDYQQLFFEDRNKWRKWLEENHQTSEGIFLIYYKKNCGKKSMLYAEAVEEALCFGWIDSIVKRIDEDRYMQKFTSRRPNSIWSEINKKRVVKLIEENKMTIAGLEKIEIAKKNGKWYQESKMNYELDKKYFKTLYSNQKALHEYQKLRPSYKKQYINWIMSAKKDETKIRRTEKMIDMLLQGKHFI